MPEGSHSTVSPWHLEDPPSHLRGRNEAFAKIKCLHLTNQIARFHYTNISISHSALLGYDIVPPLSTVQLLTNNQTLEVLRLQNCGLDDDDVICSLAKGLEHSKLKELYLGGNEFSSIGAAELSRVLTTHPTVKEVTVCPHLQRLLPRRFQLSSPSSQQQRRYW